MATDSPRSVGGRSTPRSVSGRGSPRPQSGHGTSGRSSPFSPPRLDFAPITRSTSSHVVVQTANSNHANSNHSGPLSPLSKERISRRQSISLDDLEAIVRTMQLKLESGDEMHALARAMRANTQLVVDRHHRLRLYKRSASGEHIVKWLEENAPRILASKDTPASAVPASLPLPEAVMLGQRLYDARFIQEVSNSKQFQNRPTVFYRFVQDAEEKVPCPLAVRFFVAWKLSRHYPHPSGSRSPRLTTIGMGAFKPISPRGEHRSSMIAASDLSLPPAASSTAHHAPSLRLGFLALPSLPPSAVDTSDTATTPHAAAAHHADSAANQQDPTSLSGADLPTHSENVSLDISVSDTSFNDIVSEKSGIETRPVPPLPLRHAQGHNKALSMSVSSPVLPLEASKLPLSARASANVAFVPRARTRNAALRSLSVSPAGSDESSQSPIPLTPEADDPVSPSSDLLSPPTGHEPTPSHARSATLTTSSSTVSTAEPSPSNTALSPVPTSSSGDLLSPAALSARLAQRRPSFSSALNRLSLFRRAQSKPDIPAAGGGVAATHSQLYFVDALILGAHSVVPALLVMNCDDAMLYQFRSLKGEGLREKEVIAHQYGIQLRRLCSQLDMRVPSHTTAAGEPMPDTFSQTFGLVYSPNSISGPSMSFSSSPRPQADDLPSPPMDSASAEIGGMLYQALQKAAPLHNNKKPDQCIEILKQAAESVIKQESIKNHECCLSLQNALSALSSANNGQHQVWILRRAFEVALAHLKRGPSNGPADEEKKAADAALHLMQNRASSMVPNHILTHPVMAVPIPSTRWFLTELSLAVSQLSPSLRTLLKDHKFSSTDAATQEENSNMLRELESEHGRVTFYVFHIIYGPDAQAQVLDVLATSGAERDGLIQALNVNRAERVEANRRDSLSMLLKCIRPDSVAAKRQPSAAEKGGAAPPPPLDREMSQSKLGGTLKDPAVHLTFPLVMETPFLRACFADFLNNNLAGESIRFLDAVEAYRSIPDMDNRRRAAELIFATFIAPGKATEPINIDSPTTSAIAHCMANNYFPLDMFDAAEVGTNKLLKADIFRRFTRAPEFQEMAFAFAFVEDRTSKRFGTREREQEAQRLVLSMRTRAFRRKNTFSILPVIEIYDELDNLVAAIHNAGLVRDRWSMLRRHNNCITGAELVDWLVKQRYALSRSGAIAIGQRLMDSLMLRHVTDDHDFEDNAHHYRFSELDGRGEQRYSSLPPLQYSTSAASLLWQPDENTCSAELLLKGAKYCPFFVVLTQLQTMPTMYLFRNCESNHPAAVCDLFAAQCTFFLNADSTAPAQVCYLQFELPPQKQGPGHGVSLSAALAMDGNMPSFLRSRTAFERLPTDSHTHSPRDGQDRAPSSEDISTYMQQEPVANPAAPVNEIATSVHSRNRKRILTFRMQLRDRQRWHDALLRATIPVQVHVQQAVVAPVL